MVANFFKDIGKGILNIFVIPAFLVGLAISAVFGFIAFIFIGIKKAFLFITGRNISNELPEDIEAKKIIEAKNAPKAETKVEFVQAVIQDPRVANPQPTPVQQQIPVKQPDIVIEQNPVQIDNQPVFMEIPQGQESVKNETTASEISTDNEENPFGEFEPKVGKY